MDIPMILRLALLALRDQGRAALGIVYQAKHGIVRIAGFVGEVDTGVEMPQHAAHEQADHDMRRSRRSPPWKGRPGHDR